MLLLAAAAIAAASAPQSAPAEPARPAVQARATVRIISGVRLRLGEGANPGAPAPRTTTIQSVGIDQPAKLIEFQ